MCIGKTIFRTALIGGLGVGAATLIWPDQMFAGFHQVQQRVSQVVDHAIDDPIVLRRQLQEISQELPEKIGELRSEIAEVDSQIAQLSRDTEVSKKVVAMTTSDLEDLGGMLAQASGNTSARRVAFSFQGNRMSVDRAQREFQRIASIRTQYADRIEANQRDLGYLTTQRERLGDLLANLENEYGTIQSQMWQIDRRIDAIARSERLADTLEEREAAFDKFSGKFDVSSLEQLQARLKKWEIEVGTRLEALDQQFHMKDYERQANTELDFDLSGDDTYRIELPTFEEDEASHEDSVAYGYGTEQD